MNDDTSDRRRRPGPRRAGAAAVAGLALLAAACGRAGSPVPPPRPPAPLAATAQALAYARCMRSHGIPDFPDPAADGHALFPLGGIDIHTPQYQSADNTCQKRTGAGHFTPAQQRQGVTALLRYAACMRSQGITNWPDPFANSQQIGFHLTGIDLTAPKVRAAGKTCQPLWPGP